MNLSLFTEQMTSLLTACHIQKTADLGWLATDNDQQI